MPMIQAIEMSFPRLTENILSCFKIESEINNKRQKKRKKKIWSTNECNDKKSDTKTVSQLSLVFFLLAIEHLQI